MSFSCKIVLVFLAFKSLSTYLNAQTPLGTRSAYLGSRGEPTLHAPSPAWSTRCATLSSHFHLWCESFIRSACSLQATINKFHLPTKCSLVPTPKDGSKARHSRKHSPWMLRLSSLGCGKCFMTISTRLFNSHFAGTLSTRSASSLGASHLLRQIHQSGHSGTHCRLTNTVPSSRRMCTTGRRRQIRSLARRRGRCPRRVPLWWPAKRKPKMGKVGRNIIHTIINTNPSAPMKPSSIRMRLTLMRLMFLKYGLLDVTLVRSTVALLIPVCVPVNISFLHVDVGGGSVSNSSQHNLARIPLRWMIRQCFLTNTGILFHGKLLQAIGLDPSSLYPVVKPRPPALAYSATPTTPASTTKMTGTTKTLVNPRDSNLSTFKGDTISVGYIDVSPSSIGALSEEEEDLADSLCRIYDQLRLAPLWWILELFPIRQPMQRDDNNTWVQNLMWVFLLLYTPHLVSVWWDNVS